jgi:predicted nucleotide-binding protein
VAKSSRQPPAIPPSLSPSAAKAALQNAVERGRKLLAANSVEAAQFDTWRNVTRESLIGAFGSESQHVTTFMWAGRPAGIAVVGPSWGGADRTDWNQRRHDELKKKIEVIVAILDAVDFGPDQTAIPEEKVEEESSVPMSREVFVVHGHDDATKVKVARLLERLDFQPVILHERPNEGLTIIEKFEKHAGKASFAVVLLTPDDVGCAESEGKTKPRARQNVILELGYFIGRLGRSRVCVLYTPGVELPSDILGVVYTPLDPSWEFSVAKELRAAGFAIDMNRL